MRKNYRKDDFIGSTTLSVGRNPLLNKYNALFLVTVLDLERYRYSFGISDANTFFINSYYDPKNKSYYIINGNSIDVRCYNLKDGSLFNRYQGKPRSFHTGAIIYDTKTETTLIDIDGVSIP